MTGKGILQSPMRPDSKTSIGLKKWTRCICGHGL